MSANNMASIVVPIKVNDLVKIDGNLQGRVVRIVQPLGSYNIYVVKTDDIGELNIPRFRLRPLPETVTTQPPSARI